MRASKNNRYLMDRYNNSQNIYSYEKNINQIKEKIYN